MIDFGEDDVSLPLNCTLNRLMASGTEYLLGLVIRPGSSADTVCGRNKKQTARVTPITRFMQTPNALGNRQSWRDSNYDTIAASKRKSAALFRRWLSCLTPDTRSGWRPGYGHRLWRWTVHLPSVTPSPCRSRWCWPWQPRCAVRSISGFGALWCSISPTTTWHARCGSKASLTRTCRHLRRSCNAAPAWLVRSRRPECSERSERRLRSWVVSKA